MSDLVHTDDVPVHVKVSRRHACLTLSNNVLSFLFRRDNPILVPLADAHSVIVTSDRTAICLRVPRNILPGTKRLCPSFIIEGNLKHVAKLLLALPCAIDARHAPLYTTACKRSAVQLLPDASACVWQATECTHVREIHTAVLQRTKGGMSTYDVHLLHKGCDKVTTIEMLPHSTLAVWESSLGSKHVFDYGPDPMYQEDLVSLYAECGGTWNDVIASCKELCEMSEEENSDSDYDLANGDSSLSEDDLCLSDEESTESEDETVTTSDDETVTSDESSTIEEDDDSQGECE